MKIKPKFRDTDYEKIRAKNLAKNRAKALQSQRQFKRPQEKTNHATDY